MVFGAIEALQPFASLRIVATLGSVAPLRRVECPSILTHIWLADWPFEFDIILLNRFLAINPPWWLTATVVYFDIVAAHHLIVLPEAHCGVCVVVSSDCLRRGHS